MPKNGLVPFNVPFREYNQIVQNVKTGLRKSAAISSDKLPTPRYIILLFQAKFITGNRFVDSQIQFQSIISNLSE